MSERQSAIRKMGMRMTPPTTTDRGTRPTVVCLCGSMRFWREFQRASLRETLDGNIVLSIGAASGTDDEHFGNLPRAEYDQIKAMLDELHLRKVEMADEVLILNVGGYIGQSTRRELEHALRLGKRVRYLEPQAVGVGGVKRIPIIRNPPSAIARGEDLLTVAALRPEELIALNEAAAHFPRRAGRKVSYRTLWRWATGGVAGVRLETVIVGGGRYTTAAAIADFNAARNSPPPGSRAFAGSPRDARLKAYLRREGLLTA